MPNPAFRSATSNNTGAFNLFPIAKPAGVIDGDLLIVLLETYDSNGTMAHGTPPTGWTLLDARNTVQQIRTSLYWKIAASEPSSWTFTKTNDSSSGFGGTISCTAISDPGSSSPFASWAGAIDSNTADLLVTAPSIVVASATNLLVFAASLRSSPSITFTPPAGYTERVDVYQGSQGQAQTVATMVAGATGATGPVSAAHTNNLSSAVGVGFLMAIGVAVLAPVADFIGTPLTGSAPLSVAFTDTSTNTPTSWAWDFGDGATLTSQNPSHTYVSGGVYTVALTATNAAGPNTKTRTGYITVSEPIAYATGGGIEIY